MKLNLDLLKKLTRLANNNPNDNEANLAARKVCKMLEECQFSLVEPKASVTNSEPDPHFDAIFRDLFYGSRRSPANPFTWGGSGPDYVKYTPPNTYTPPGWTNNPTRPKSQKRELKCIKCGKFYMTSFVGHELNFRCGDCFHIK